MVNVVLIPGFLFGGWAMRFLRRTLARRGHVAEVWPCGVNLGFAPDELRRDEHPLVRQIQRLHGANGQPVVVIGWSLGGTIALAMAHLHPRVVGGVVTLGTAHAPRRGQADVMILNPVVWLVRGLMELAFLLVRQTSMTRVMRQLAEEELGELPACPLLTIAGRFDPLPCAAVLMGPRQAVVLSDHMLLPLVSGTDVVAFVDEVAAARERGAPG